MSSTNEYRRTDLLHPDQVVLPSDLIPAGRYPADLDREFSALSIREQAAIFADYNVAWLPVPPHWVGFLKRELDIQISPFTGTSPERVHRAGGCQARHMIVRPGNDAPPFD